MQRVVIAVLVVWGAIRLARHLAPVARLPGPEARVERVIDGDTVQLTGGDRVRLLGINTPEFRTAEHPAEAWGKEAARFTRDLLEGKEVRLEFDRERHDRYRRILAYVWVGDRLANAEIVRAGFSRAETGFPLRTDRKRLLETAEREARGAQRGLWSPTSAPVTETAPLPAGSSGSASR